MSDNPEKIAELQSDKLVETLLSKNLGVPVCRHIESKGHNGQQFVKPEYVIETFPSVEFLRSIKLLKAQIRSLVSVRKELHVETSTVPYLEINNSNNSNASAAAAASSSSSQTTTTLAAEEAEKLLQEAAPLLTNKKYSEAIALYSKVVDAISLNEDDSTLKQILSRGLSNRSGCFLGLKKSQEALDDARRCVDVRPSWVRAHLRVAAAAEDLEEFDLAIAAYESAIKAEDRSGNVPSNKELETEILRVKRKNWKEVISETTNEFDHIFNPETKTVAPETIVRFCAYLQVCITDKHPSSTRHKIAAREGLVWISKFITDFERTHSYTKGAHSFCSFINNVTRTSTKNYDENRKLFGTEDVRDALLLVSKYCTSTESAMVFCGSILNLAMDDESQKLFGTAAIRDALLLVSKYCTDSKSARNFCASIGNLTFINENIQKLFATADVRTALLLVSRYCTDSESAKFFCLSIQNLTHNQNLIDNQKLFGIAAVRDALLLVSKHCTDDESAIVLCGCIYNLTNNNDENKSLFGTEAVSDALYAVSKYCTTPDSAERAIKVLSQLSFT